MHAHTQLDQASSDIRFNILNRLDLAACIRFLIANKHLYKMLESGDAVKILCFADIINAITTDKTPTTTTSILRAILKKDLTPCKGILRDNQTISLSYANYGKHTIHPAFCIFQQQRDRNEFFLTPDAVMKNVPNFSSVKWLSPFNIPLMKINWKNLCEKQFVSYTEKFENQPLEYIPFFPTSRY
jgi:hypothetical protein